MALTPKQATFVREYLIDLNGTQAAIRAGYSEKTARQIADQLLSKLDITEAVGKAMDKRAARTEITADRVLAEMAKVGFANLSDVVSWGSKEVAIGYDDDGKRLSPQDIGDAVMVQRELAPYVDAVESCDLPEHVRSAVSEVALTKDGLKIKMHDKNAALVSLARHLGMFVERREVTGKDGEALIPAITDLERAKAIASLVQKMQSGG